MGIGRFFGSGRPRDGSSRSWTSPSGTSAGVTARPHTSPSASTHACRFTPVAFFPHVVPSRAGLVGPLDRLAIDDPRRRGRTRPPLGGEVNKLARQGFAVTLLNPVGLYIDSLETVGWVTPNGTPASQFWTAVRGTAGMTVRAVFEVPASEGYAVGDIEIGGQPIAFGGQIAEHVNVKLTGIACRQGSFANPPRECPEPADCSAQPAPGAGGLAPAVAVAPAPAPKGYKLPSRR